MTKKLEGLEGQEVELLLMQMEVKLEEQEQQIKVLLEELLTQLVHQIIQLVEEVGLEESVRLEHLEVLE